MDTAETLHVETAPFPQQIVKPCCGEKATRLILDERTSGTSCRNCRERIDYIHDRQETEVVDETEQVELLTDGGTPNAGLYRRVARTAVRASPVFIGSVLLFIAAVAVGQLATGTFDHSLAGLVEGVLAAMFIGLPAYLTAIAIAHAVLMEHTEVTP